MLGTFYRSADASDQVSNNGDGTVFEYRICKKRAIMSEVELVDKESFK
jgi:hypothetical protein